MSLTGANSIIMLGVTDLFDTPQQIQGYSAENVFDAAAVKLAETSMGIDGKLSGGFIYAEIEQGFELQADSPSVSFFDTLAQAMLSQQDTYELFGTVTLPGLNTTYNMTTGFLTDYPPIPAVGKLIKPRKFIIRWQSITPAPAP